MKQTVTFITSPSGFLLDEKVFVTLGILKVAAVAEQLGYAVEHLDLSGVSNYEEVVADYCSQSNTPIFAITATTPQMVAATKIRNVIRRMTNSKIIIGGPHVTLIHASLKHTERGRDTWNDILQGWDCVVVGDGEDAIKLAIESDSKVIDADDPRGDLFLTTARLAELPLPARHLVDIQSYKYIIDSVDSTLLMGQLGCPMSCSFCGGRNSPMLRRMRLRPSSSITGEIQHLYETYGYRGFYFGDDELNINKQFIELLQDLCNLQERLGVEFRFRGFLKSEFITEQQAIMMKKAGFRQLLCGFESGSDRILRNIRKHATKDQNTKALELSHKYDLGMKALMSIGHPGESEQTIQETIDWVLSAAPVQADFTIITPYPGSPYWDNAVHIGNGVWRFEDFGDALYSIDVDYSVTENYYKGIPGSYESYVFTDYLTREDIVRLRDSAEKTYRDRFGVPYYHSAPALMYEHSMGATPFLRKSK